jgi:anti-sigma factor RsiW
LKQTKIDKRVSAYADGALDGARRARLERELEEDAELREGLQRTQALGRLVRDAWNEGPPAPSADFLLASLRSELAAIDRERRAQPAWQQALERARGALGRWLGPVPIATSAAAAFLLALLVMPGAMSPVGGVTAALPAAPAASIEPVVLPQSRAPRPAGGLFAPADFSGSIYDVSPSERPAMLFQGKDGSTMLWLLDDDGLSYFLESMDRWG